MKDFVVGAQLYSVRSLAQNAEDLAKTLKALKEMGYNTVQLSGQSRCPGHSFIWYITAFSSPMQADSADSVRPYIRRRSGAMGR